VEVLALLLVGFGNLRLDPFGRFVWMTKPCSGRLNDVREWELAATPYPLAVVPRTPTPDPCCWP